MHITDGVGLARERLGGGLVEVRHHNRKAIAWFVELSERREPEIARL